MATQPAATTPRAATNTYDDLLVRSSIEDTGQIPFPGTPSSSPDIIPAGTEPRNPQSFLADMRKDYSQNLQGGQDNYLYVRGVNLAPKSQSGLMHLYWSPASLLPYPRQWSGNELPLETGAIGSPVQAAQGANFVTAAPFMWRGVPQPPPGDHFCLIGRMVTAEHPDPIPDVFSMPSFAEWIVKNRGLSWRNVTVVYDRNAPVSEHVHYAQGETTEVVYVQLVCSNIPVGAEIGFHCGTPGPDPLIDLPPVKVTTPTQVAGMATRIPAGWASNITYTYRSNGKTPPDPTKPSNLTLEVVYVPQADSPLQAFAIPLSKLGVREQDMLPEHLEASGPKLGIRLGSYQSRFPVS